MKIAFLSKYNTKMHLVAMKSNVDHTPLAFQWDVPWECASPEAKSQSVERPVRIVSWCAT